MQNNLKKDTSIVNIAEILSKYGPRPLGAKIIPKISKLLSDFWTKLGWKTEILKYETIGWELNNYTLSNSKSNFSVLVNPYSPECQVSGEILPIWDLESLRKFNQNQVKRKILLLLGDLSKEWLFPLNYPFFQEPRHQEIYTILNKLQPKAIIFASHEFYNPTAISSDQNFLIPSITLGSNVAIDILNSIKENYELTINSTRNKINGCHILAQIGDISKPKIVICAHLDTTFNSLGAHDNLSGILCLIELSRLIPSLSLDFSIELIAITGHEYSGIPETIYFDKFSENLKEICLFINVDAVGHKIISDQISFYNIDEDTQQKIFPKHLQDEFLKIGDPWYQGEHMIAINAGIPCIAISAGKSLDIHHTQADSLDVLNFLRIESLAKHISNLISRF